MTRADQNIVNNLRFRWREQLTPYSDEMLAEEYEAFGQSDMHGNNDARFLEWLGVDQ